MSGPAIAVIMSGFPRRSETFALNELLALQDHGLLHAMFATKAGDLLDPQPAVLRLRGAWQVLPRGDRSTQAGALVDQLRGARIDGVHGYFAHEPTDLAMEVARRLDVPYGFSVHARDARKVAPASLASRARGAACVVACNPDVAGELAAAGASVQVLPHGVDLDRFRPLPPSGGRTLRLLAVGRLVEKKGFAVLVDAVSRLRRPFDLRIVGDGPERAALEAQAVQAGVRDRIVFCGSRTHAELPAEYAAADVVVVPSIADRTGDRDGLPNVVLEAMASARPVVAANLAAIPSAVRDGETGLLVPPGDASALSAAVDQLSASPTRLERYGRAGRCRVERDFDLDDCARRFCGALAAAYA